VLTSTLQKSSSHLLNYLDEIDEMIKNPELANDPMKVQYLIESEWIEIIKRKLSDPNLSKHRLVTSMNKLNRSLSAYCKKSHVLKSKFPNFIDEINQIESLIIAVFMAITFFSKYGYTHIASLIGKAVMYSIYKNQLKHAKLEYYKINNLKIDEASPELNKFNIVDFIDLHNLTNLYNIRFFL
jgi:hypothetical protein